MTASGSSSSAGASGPGLTALVLAGGQARRMGGEKAGLLVGTRSMLDHAVSVARAVADEVLLLAGPRDYVVPDGRRVADWPDVAGPLGGLGAGLEAARHDWCLLLACDMPHLDGSVVARLMAARDRAPAVDAVVATLDGERQPFPGLYHRRVAAQARVTAITGQGSLRRLLDRLNVLEVPAPADDPRALQDVDTPRELSAARGAFDT